VGKTHCDIVVEVRPGRIRVIGGNVSQTVGDTWLRTPSDGRLSLVGTQSPLFAAICCRPGSASPPALTPAPAPGTAGEDARVLRVMELLVNRYRYPVNGAAGLVGNLIAESSVLPNRIEGSHSATPMRAPDFTGRLRDFTADQVRDRSFGRRAFGIDHQTVEAKRAQGGFPAPPGSPWSPSPTPTGASCCWASMRTAAASM
jgi:Uncharacterized protein conserved in bacteria (DUF2272)